MGGQPVSSKVCYGVNARVAQSLPVPLMETVVSDDPEDPVFYSTCFVREEEIIWEPTGKEQQPSPSKWKFDRGCIDCTLYSKNNAPGHPDFVVPSWAISDQCFDCDQGHS